MDQALVRNLFDITARASEALGIDGDFRRQLRQRLDSMQGYRIGSRGQILEWDREYAEKEPGHRHVSHLVGLYPGSDITPAQPALFEAARKSLEGRGNLGTGWSMAWKVSLWARLLDGAPRSLARGRGTRPAGPRRIHRRLRLERRPARLRRHPQQPRRRGTCDLRHAHADSHPGPGRDPARQLLTSTRIHKAAPYSCTARPRTALIPGDTRRKNQKL